MYFAYVICRLALALVVMVVALLMFDWIRFHADNAGLQNRYW